MNNKVISSEFYENSRTFYRINSFVRRQRRLTKSQQHALDNYWPKMGIDFKKKPLNYAALFGCEAPIILEIGFGMGSSLVEMAKAHPEKNFLGIEVYSPGVGACLATAHNEGVKNLRVIYHDAVEVLTTMIPDNSLDTVQLFFPDPWQKTRHNKRRIVQASFVELVKNKLKLDSIFHIATDCQSYAQHILKVMLGLSEYYQNQSKKNTYVSRPKSRPLTKFEQRSYRLGHDIWDLMFKKIK